VQKTQASPLFDKPTSRSSKPACGTKRRTPVSHGLHLLTGLLACFPSASLLIIFGITAQRSHVRNMPRYRSSVEHIREAAGAQCSACMKSWNCPCLPDSYGYDTFPGFVTRHNTCWISLVKQLKFIGRADKYGASFASHFSYFACSPTLLLLLSILLPCLIVLPSEVFAFLSRYDKIILSFIFLSITQTSHRHFLILEFANGPCSIVENSTTRVSSVRCRPTRAGFAESLLDSKDYRLAHFAIVICISPAQISFDVSDNFTQGYLSRMQLRLYTTRGFCFLPAILAQPFCPLGHYSFFISSTVSLSSSHPLLTRASH
jgi:hypothetical protein